MQSVRKQRSRLNPAKGDTWFAWAGETRRAESGQQYAVADRYKDWTAIWYLGQKAWFRNPHKD
ncbi:hypothetical protein ACWD3P_46615, partial [Streptomyces sp. NPDC002765]